MITCCTVGLFVGVGEYHHAPKLGELSLAVTDARTMCDYFRGASTRGSWKLVASLGDSNPTRAEVVKALHWLADKVPSAGVGLFYFSGHGKLDNKKGLILAVSDYQQQWPFDTGLPLSRVLEILKNKGPEKRFLVILDCCRDGRQPVTADIPPNICLLYACSSGESAFEGTGGGFFTRSLHECLEAAAREAGRQSYCTIRDIDHRLRHSVFPWRPLSAVTHELHGNLADQVALPIICNRPVESPTARPRCILEYWLANETEFYDHYMLLGCEVLRWFNVRARSLSEKALLSEIFEHDFRPGNEEYWLRLRIPDSGLHWRSSEFLENILSLDTTDPKIVYKWPWALKSSIFKMMLTPIKGKLRPMGSKGDAEQYWLTWDNDPIEGVTYEGMAAITIDSTGSTTVSLSCYTKEDQNPTSIRFLLPTLIVVHNLFQSAGNF